MTRSEDVPTTVKVRNHTDTVDFTPTTPWVPGLTNSLEGFHRVDFDYLILELGSWKTGVPVFRNKILCDRPQPPLLPFPSRDVTPDPVTM